MKKKVILLAALIVLISVPFLLHNRLKAESMGTYEYDRRKLGVAVTRLMTSKSVMHNFGKPIYPENREAQYIWVYISLINSGSSAVSVKPEEFALSVPGEASVSYDTKATNSMQKCLKEISLEPGKQHVGVLIFPISESSDYVLHYSSPQGKIEKKLAAD